MTLTQNAPAAAEIEAQSRWVGELRGALHEVIIGQEELLHGLMLGLLTGGHLLLEGVPVGSSRVDLQACKLEYSIVSPK